ncbi:MAG: CvpA family protein [Muribaculaceae bacterium]|nr:CvpA family protein [Muribaculaceae bacterium]
MLNHAAGLGKAIIRYIIMTIVDAIIIIIVLGGLVIGYRKGLITQLASLISWIVAIVLCYKGGELAQSIFLAIVPSAAQWPLASITVKTVSLAFAFLVVMLSIRLVMRLFKGALDSIHLGLIDKAGGSLLFMFKYAFLLSLVLNLLYAFNPDMDTFGTKHMLNNKPYEMTLDLMPRILGSEQMPSDSLKLYRDLIEPVPIDSSFNANS